MRPPYQATESGLVVRLKVMPKARREGATGLGQDADGGTYLKIAVNEAPEGGKANQAVIALLARELGVAKAAISVAAGATGRRKVVEIRGPTASLVARMAAWTGKLAQ